MRAYFLALYTLLATLLALLAVAHAQSASSPGAHPETSPARSAGNPIAMQPIKARFCRALAPAGWHIVDQDDRGTTITLGSADQSVKAAYGIVAIDTAQAQGFYGQQYRTPAIFAQFMASAIAGEQMQTAGSQNFMGLQVLALRGTGTRGFVLYRVYPLAGDPGGYIISARTALGSQQTEAIAGAVASAISCSTILTPPAGAYAQVRSRGTDIGTSAKCKAGDCDDGDLAGTYNVQLGTGYVHSASGQNYLVDPANDYRQTGPDGPGYYRQTGNNLEKLEPGRSE